MKKLTTILLAYLMAMGPAFAASPYTITSDSLKLGRGDRAVDKDITFNTGAGANNVKLTVDDVTRNTTLSKAPVTSLQSATVNVGDGTAADQALKFDKGSGASNPLIRWNNASSKLEFANDGSTYKAIGSGAGGGSGVNMLADYNFDMEAGILNWTGSVVAPIGETTYIENGAKSLSWDAGASGQTLCSQAVTISDSSFGGLKGASCSSTIYYRAPTLVANDLSLKAYSSAVSDYIGSVDLTPTASSGAGEWVKAVATYPCPESGTLKTCVYANADAAVVKLDDATQGRNDTIDVSLASSWETYTPVFTGFGTVTEVSIEYRRVGDSLEIQGRYKTGTPTAVEGRISLPTGLTMGSPSATEVCGTLAPDTTLAAPFYLVCGTGLAYFAFSRVDASNSPATRALGNNGIPTTQFVMIHGRVKINEWAGLSKTIAADITSWHIDANIGGANPSLGTGDVATYQGITDAGLDLVINSGSSTAYIPCSSTNDSTGLTCSAGDESIGIAPFFPRAGRIEMCFDLNHHVYVNNGTMYSTFSIMETGNANQTVTQTGKTKKESGSYGPGVIENTFPHRLCDEFSVTSVGKHTFRVFYEQDATGTVSGNTIRADRDAATGQRDIKVSVRYVDQNQTMPNWTNGVISSSSGMESTERVIVSTVCTSSPCTMAYNSPAVTSVTRAAQGVYLVNIAAGRFKTEATCTGSAFDTGARHCMGGFDPSSTQSATVKTFVTNCDSTFTTNEDAAFEIVCFGPR